MKDIFKLGGLLLIITTVAATALAAIYSVTKPRIDAQKQLAIDNALTVALPGAPREAIEPVMQGDEVEYYIGYESEQKQDTVGYAYIAAGAGYSSVVETMVGIDTTGKIIGLQVLSQQETPGLGTKIIEVKYGEEKPWFLQQFMGRPADQVKVDKDGGQIQSITGATITSRTLTNSIVEGYEDLRQTVNN